MTNEKAVLAVVRAGVGRRVLAPDGSAVPVAGFKVDPRDPWWAKALENGDVVRLSDTEIAAVQADADAAAGQAKAGQATNAQGADKEAASQAGQGNADKVAASDGKGGK